MKWSLTTQSAFVPRLLRERPLGLSRAAIIYIPNSTLGGVGEPAAGGAASGAATRCGTGAVE